MPSFSLHPTPAWSEVAREQVRAVGLVLRREAVLLALLLVAISALILVADSQGVGEGAASFDPEIAGPVVLLAFFAGLSVWRGEEPSRRAYFWSLPVDRVRHTLTRVGAGWVWLMVLLVSYMLVMLVLALITGGEIATGQGYAYIGERGPSAVPDTSLLREITWAVGVWEWAIPVVAITIAYLLGSIVAILSDHPWRWFAGIPLGFWLAVVILLFTGMRPVADQLLAVLVGKFGLFTALSGEGSVIHEFTRPDGTTLQREISRPTLSSWVPAAALWLTLSMAAVFAAARVHQER